MSPCRSSDSDRISVGCKVEKGGFPCFQEVDTSNHQWANYFMCAYKARSGAKGLSGRIWTGLHSVCSSFFFNLHCASLATGSRCLKEQVAACASMGAGRLQGVFEFLEGKGVQRTPVGLKVMVHGTVPQGEAAALPGSAPWHPAAVEHRLAPPDAKCW